MSPTGVGGGGKEQASKYHKELCKSAVVLSLFPISTIIIALLEVSNYYFHQCLEMMLATGAAERAVYGKTEHPLRKLEHMFINCLNHQTSGSRMKLFHNICMQKLGSSVVSYTFPTTTEVSSFPDGLWQEVHEAQLSFRLELLKSAMMSELYLDWSKSVFPIRICLM